MRLNRLSSGEMIENLLAQGHVQAVFQQASSPFEGPAGPSGKAAHAAEGPTLWKVHGPLLTYWSDQAKARMEGGVTADSDQGSLTSQTLDVFLNPSDDPSKGAKASAPSASVPHPASKSAASSKPGKATGN